MPCIHLLIDNKPWEKWTSEEQGVGIPHYLTLIQEGRLGCSISKHPPTKRMAERFCCRQHGARLCPRFIRWLREQYGV